MKKQPIRTASKTVQKEIDPPLPQPMELAKLAAMLMPNAQPAEALEKAMLWYEQAVRVCEGEATAYVETIAAGVESLNADTRHLDVKKDGDDEVRNYLSDLSLEIKTVRGVLNNARKYLQALPDLPFSPRPNPDIVIASWQCEGGYAIPCGTLQAMAKRAKRLSSDTKVKAWRKRKERLKAAGKKNRLSSARRSRVR